MTQKVFGICIGIILLMSGSYTFSYSLTDTGFLDDGGSAWFWSQNPTSGQIIERFFATGNEYTNFWTGYTGCDIPTINVHYIQPGYNFTNVVRTGNTIYVLGSGVHILTGYMDFNSVGNCIGIVGQGDVEIQSDIYLNFAMINFQGNKNVIVDNITLNGLSGHVGKNDNGLINTTANDYNFSVNNSLISHMDLHGLLLPGFSKVYNSEFSYNANGLVSIVGNVFFEKIIAHNNNYGITAGFPSFYPNVYIYDSDTYNNLYVGVHMIKANDSVVENVRSYNNGIVGIYINQGNNINLNKNVSRSNGNYGIFVENNSNLRIENSQIYNNSGDGIYVLQPLFGPNVVVNNNLVFNNGIRGVFFEGGEKNAVNNNQIFNNTYGGLTFMAVNKSVMNNNYLYNNGWGVVLHTGSYISGNNNYIYNNQEGYFLQVSDLTHFGNLTLGNNIGGNTIYMPASLNYSAFDWPGYTNSPSWISGSVGTPITISCDYATQPQYSSIDDKVGSVWYYTNSTCSNTGQRIPSMSTPISCYKFGSQIGQQQQPVIRSNTENNFVNDTGRTFNIDAIGYVSGMCDHTPINTCLVSMTGITQLSGFDISYNCIGSPSSPVSGFTIQAPYGIFNFNSTGNFLTTTGIGIYTGTCTLQNGAVCIGTINVNPAPQCLAQISPVSANQNVPVSVGCLSYPFASSISSLSVTNPLLGSQIFGTASVYTSTNLTGNYVVTCNLNNGATCGGNFSISQTPISCGNGIVEGGEQCDDGNGNTNDTCSNSCTINICPCGGTYPSCHSCGGGGGGGGGGGSLWPDECGGPKNPNRTDQFDYSPSYYDGLCGLPNTSVDLSKILLPYQSIQSQCKYSDHNYENIILTDLIQSTIYAEDIQTLLYSCIISGTPGSNQRHKFFPDASVTRAEFIKVLIKSFFIHQGVFIPREDGSYRSKYFDDVKNKWFALYIDTFKELSFGNFLDQMYGDQKNFFPLQKVQRNEFFSIINKALIRLGKTTVELPFLANERGYISRKEMAHYIVTLFGYDKKIIVLKSQTYNELKKIVENLQGKDKATQKNLLMKYMATIHGMTEEELLVNYRIYKKYLLEDLKTMLVWLNE